MIFEIDFEIWSKNDYPNVHILICIVFFMIGVRRYPAIEWPFMHPSSIPISTRSVRVHAVGDDDRRVLCRHPRRGPSRSHQSVPYQHQLR